MTLRFPTPHKYDRLGSAARRLARIPRYGRLIAMLPVTRFDRLVSEPATFWEVYTYICLDPSGETGILDSGLRATRARQLGWARQSGQEEPPRDLDFREYQVHRACDILGAVAFEMFCVGDGPHHAVSDTKLLRQSTINRLHAAGVTDVFGDPVPKSDLYRDLESLFAMDAADLKYFIFAEGKREVRWTDITTQAFFAAYWACRWSNDADRSMMREWLPDPLEGTNSNYKYLEYWRMVAEMPEEACDRERYELLLSPLYDGRFIDEEGLPIRLTELIYRTWDRMKATAAGRKLRGEFREVLAGSRGEEARVVARGLLTDFEGESHFVSLCEGKRGEKDTGRFVMGAPEGEKPAWDGRGEKQDNPLHSVRLSHYRLHRCCVTNVEFELFDRRRELRRAFSDEGRDVSGHPVVNVTWYGAWCFARWVGAITIGVRNDDGRGNWSERHVEYRLELPTEAEWEYTCRCGEETPFTWESGRDGNRIESKYCNFNGNHPWSAPEHTAAKAGPDRERTVPVDEFATNPWGFYQMHGNVWEWCADWYESDFYRRRGEVVVDPLCDSSLARARVVRGGCWLFRGRRCRSANRRRFAPDFGYGGGGFRLAAVPADRSVRR